MFCKRFSNYFFKLSLSDMEEIGATN